MDDQDQARADAIVTWAERQGRAEIAPRHPPGRGSQVHPDERREIQKAHLLDGMSQSELARRFGRTRETIAACLKGEDYDRLREEVDLAGVEEARRILSSGREQAAQAWVSTLSVAAAKGDHRPAKDLLAHTGVIEDASAQSAVQILIGMPGQPLQGPPELVAITVGFNKSSGAGD